MITSKHEWKKFEDEIRSFDRVVTQIMVRYTYQKCGMVVTYDERVAKKLGLSKRKFPPFDKNREDCDKFLVNQVHNS